MVTRDSLLPPHVLPLAMLIVLNTADGRMVVSRECVLVHERVCVVERVKKGEGTCAHICVMEEGSVYNAGVD